MKHWHYSLIFLIGLLVRIGVGAFQKNPGFMDAEYYFIGGRNLAQGAGFSENIIWNFLDNPEGLPHPSHGYWMPFASIVAALGLVAAQSQQFIAAQYLFILIASFFPPLTAYLCFLLTRERILSILAGGLAILSGFYLPFMTTSDTFGIYAVLGALFFILFSNPYIYKKYFSPIGIGLITGLMHLSRTDGFVWFGIGLFGFFGMANKRKNPDDPKLKSFLIDAFWLVFSYLVIMTPWFIRNYQVFGSILAPGGSLSLWILDYNEIFIYPASQLSLSRWLSSGWISILEARKWAFGINFQRSIAEQGWIFLTPLILTGFWKFRKDLRFQLGLLGWLTTFLIMTLVFPFQGARGGFFHSSAALLSLLWCSGALGLQVVLEWAHKVRNWNIHQARKIFSIAILCFALAITIFNSWTKLGKFDDQISPWEENHHTYQKIETAFRSSGVMPDEIVMTINPPGYFETTHRAAIAIPDGDVFKTIEVAKRYGAAYLVLEKDHPQGLDILYDNPQTMIKGLSYLQSVGESHLFIIE
jgi:hypothetical protein